MCFFVCLCARPEHVIYIYFFINWLPGIFNSKVISGSQYPLLFLFRTVIFMCTSGKIKFLLLFLLLLLYDRHPRYFNVRVSPTPIASISGCFMTGLFIRTYYTRTMLFLKCTTRRRSTPPTPPPPERTKKKKQKQWEHVHV